MKKILACASLFFAVATASAQGTLEENNVQINAGVGISSWGIPVVVGVDYGVARDFTIGAEASYRSQKETWYIYEWKHSVFSISANGDGDLVYNGNYASGLGIAAQIGGRYFFTKNFGINLEAGGGNVAGGKLGITYKF